MRLYAEQGLKGKVIDLDTGREVPFLIWVDEEKGQIEAYSTDDRGQRILDGQGNFYTYTAKGRFKLVVNQPDSLLGKSKPKAPPQGAPRCARCRNPLTLPGDDLCALCNAQDKGIKGFGVERLTTPLLDHRCEHKGCHRLATYQVADEVTASPFVKRNEWFPYWKARHIAFDRAMTVSRHWYCDHHFRPPRLLDPKGEVMETFDEAGGVRPQ